MRKFMRFALMVVVAMLMVGLFIGSSCDKSSDSKNNSLVGTWQLESMTLTNGSTTITMNPSAEGITMTMYVNEDGTVTMITSYDDGTPSDVETGTWTQTGDNVLVSGLDLPDGSVTYDVDGDKLTITVVDTSGTTPVTYILEWKRL